MASAHALRRSRFEPLELKQLLAGDLLTGIVGCLLAGASGCCLPTTRACAGDFTFLYQARVIEWKYRATNCCLLARHRPAAVNSGNFADLGTRRQRNLCMRPMR